ncbi:MAG: 3-phosphoserine/phosphohydroxythreonine transaminase [Oscillospiraceae bacterium]|nr:3-phosphoserine/phosphohydroxythreonine transaminase [Oscillospiraceae bacterium]
MGSARIFNFAAGPSMLPEEVLQEAAAELSNYKGTGMSVMEMSHRSDVYARIFESVQTAFRRVMNIPNNYSVLFLQGGATLQFAMVPMNLIGKTGSADYAVTGSFSGKAAKEAEKYGKIHISASSEDKNFTYIPRQEDLEIFPNASYFHYCANNTIYGTEWNYVPETGEIPLVCDMSSNILSKPVDVSKYALIYAGAQKNMAPAGLTVVIIRNDLAGNAFPYTPIMMDYATMIKNDSMYNTPPCYNIYILGLVLNWVEKLGGLKALQKRNEEKAALLYECLEESQIFHPVAEKEARSNMNVTFRSDSPELDAMFVARAADAGFVNLKGHRSVGGMRASIYNAMPPEGVAALADFIRVFEQNILR